MSLFKISQTAVALVALTGVSFADLLTDEWVFIKSATQDSYLRIDGIDAAASLSETSDSKSQWMLVASTGNNSGSYRIVNRWAQENAETEDWLWINNKNDGGYTNTVQLSNKTGSLAEWNFVETSTPSVDECFFIQTPNGSVQTPDGEHAENLWVDVANSIVRMDDATGSNAKWTVEAVPEPATMGLLVLSASMVLVLRRII